jgi:5-bromo-4-chloroindolyl phosphate hydrolysis protein
MGLKLSVILALFLLALANGILFAYWQDAFKTISLKTICYIFTTVLIMFILSNSIFIKLIIYYVERESQYNAQQAYIDNIEQLFTALKSQRHEMMTHVQALYGLIVKGEHKC